MNKIPKHLQKRIDEMAHTYELNCWRNETYQYPPETRDSFKEGAFAMHSLMLEELKSIVEALEKVAYDPAYYSSLGTSASRKALEIYQERVEVQNDNK